MRAMAALAPGTGLLLALLLLVPGSLAADKFFISASVEPGSVEVGKEVVITVNISNIDTVAYQTLKVQLFVYKEIPGSSIQPDQTVSNLSPGRSQNITYTHKPSSAAQYSLTVKVFNRTVETANYLGGREFPSQFTAIRAPDGNGGGLGGMLPVVIGIVVVVVAAGATGLIMTRKKKQAEIAPAEVARARPAAPVPPKIQGKFPKDYYKYRRERLSKLKPVGLTRSGETILGNSHRPEIEDADAAGEACKTCCPKCGTEMGADWKSCKNCSAQGALDRSRASVEKLKSFGEDTSNLEDLLTVASAALEARNYDETETYSRDVTERARTQIKKREAAGKPEGEVPLPKVVVGAPAPPAERAPAEGAPAHGAAGPLPAAAGEKAEGPPKADKKEPNACWVCGQVLKPEGKKCPSCDAIQEGFCPSCGRTVKLKWKICPHCSQDLGKHKPKLACPVCAAELPDTGPCLSCRSKALIDSVSKIVREFKSRGADVTEAEALLGRGELAFKLRNFDRAVSYFEKAEEAARRSKREYHIRVLKEKLDRSSGLIKDCTSEGADTAEPQALHDKASKALVEEKFLEGEALADRAASLASEALAKARERKAAEKPVEKAPQPVGIPRPRPQCPHCGEKVELEWAMCPFCSKPLK